MKSDYESSDHWKVYFGAFSHQALGVYSTFETKNDERNVYQFVSKQFNSEAKINGNINFECFVLF